MGLNDRRRPRRADLDPSNEFIAVAYGQTDLNFSNSDEQLIMEYQDRILEQTRKRVRDITFD